MKTTEPRRYLVKPNQNIIIAGDSKLVKINMQAKEAAIILKTYEEEEEDEEFLKLNDKFLIQWTVVDEKTVKEAKILSSHNSMATLLLPTWSSATSETLFSFKLSTKFIFPEKDQEIENLNELRSNYENIISDHIRLTEENEVLKQTIELNKKEFFQLKENFKNLQNQKNQFSLTQVIVIAALSFLIAILVNYKE